MRLALAIQTHIDPQTVASASTTAISMLKQPLPIFTNCIDIAFPTTIIISAEFVAITGTYVAAIDADDFDSPTTAITELRVHLPVVD